MNSKNKMILVVSGFILLLIVILPWLQGINKQQADANFPVFNSALIEGKRLSEIHCAKCHKYPDPGLLPWRTWRFETLPAMVPFLGIDDPNSSGHTYDPRSNPYLPQNIYPSKPQVTQKEWKKIQDYYLYLAPEKLPATEKKSDIIVDSLFFKVRYPGHKFRNHPSVTSVRFDRANRLIYLGDSGNKKFMVFNYDLNLVHHSNIESPISRIHIINDDSRPGLRTLLLTFIGSMDPSDAPYGSVKIMSYNPVLQVSTMDSVLRDGVARPVESRFADLNQDGLDDLLVNEFGHRAGRLFWLENTGSGYGQEPRILIDTPGCIQAHVLDYTGNGRPDILALCTQTAQAVYLFANRGGGRFEPRSLLHFEVTAGSSSFELHDFNGDGHLDILYTSGDNADYSHVFKPYHGVYIYLNDGQERFNRAWFYPINGAYQARARDFTGDGLLDLAVISFFADYQNSPEEGFVFFKNEGDLSFTPYHHPAAGQGRWLAMDVADWDGDGDVDIVLANYPEGPLPVAPLIQDKWNEGPHFLVLENQADQYGKTDN